MRCWKLPALADHLLIDGPQVLRTACNLEVNAKACGVEAHQSGHFLSGRSFFVHEVKPCEQHAGTPLAPSQKEQNVKLPLNRRDT